MAALSRAATVTGSLSSLAGTNLRGGGSGLELPGLRHYSSAGSAISTARSALRHPSYGAHKNSNTSAGPTPGHTSLVTPIAVGTVLTTDPLGTSKITSETGPPSSLRSAPPIGYILAPDSGVPPITVTAPSALVVEIIGVIIVARKGLPDCDTKTEES